MIEFYFLFLEMFALFLFVEGQAFVGYRQWL
jgi:hypothetical protein